MKLKTLDGKIFLGSEVVKYVYISTNLEVALIFAKISSLALSVAADNKPD